MTSVMTGRNLLGLNLQELEDFSQAHGQPRYRGRQLYHGIYARRIHDFAELTDLQRDFREKLASQYEIVYPEIQREFRSLFGFEVDGVDYDAPIETDLQL